MFSREFCEIWKKTIFTEYLRRLRLTILQSQLLLLLCIIFLASETHSRVWIVLKVFFAIFCSKSWYWGYYTHELHENIVLVIIFLRVAISMLAFWKLNLLQHIETLQFGWKKWLN